MSVIPTLASSPVNSEASQIIPTINGVINNINANAAILSRDSASFRNAVIGGAFGVNPWQRGTTFTGITNTLTYTADRFWVIGGAGSSISVSKVTTSQTPGQSASLKFGRAAANADTTAIKLGSVLETKDSIQFQGQPFVLSFYAKAGANFSAASSTLGIVVCYGTDTDGTAANYAAGSWTTQTTVTLTGSAGTTITGITATTSWARYVAAGFIPITATQIGFNLQYTPVGTAGSADNIEIAGVQLEVMANGGVNATPFERRPAELELALCQRYYYALNEGATSTVAQLTGMAQGTTTANFIVPAPVTMRANPTVTVTSGSFAILKTAGTVQTATVSPVVASGSAQGAVVKGVADSAMLAAGNATQLVGGGGAGLLKLDAEL